MKLKFVSELPLKASGGGAYAVNWHAFRQMERHFGAEYCGPVRAVVPWFEEVVSKVRRKILHRPGRFVHFSSATLDRTAEEVAEVTSAGAEIVFFRSAAPWTHIRPVVPYFVYLDAVFHTFFHNTFSPADFLESDLERIWSREAAFLEGAAAVFFESRWGMEQAILAYGLKGHHYHAIGRGGVIKPPKADRWDGSSMKLITLAMKFRQKGGDLVLEAYRMLKPRYPELTWHIIGGPPDGEWQVPGGIVYEGIIRPDEEEGNRRMTALLSEAFLLLHPTREDVNPLVPTEAAYFGCPTISVNRFALPELVLNGETGLLLEPPVTAAALAAAIESLITDRARYLEMRRQAREYAMKHFQWDTMGDAMAEKMREKLQGGRPVTTRTGGAS